MNNDALKQLISEPTNISKIITELNYNFNDLYMKYMIENLKKVNNVHIDFQKIDNHDPYSYYLNGHCMSYAEILCAIFGKNETVKYNSDNHVIVKIANHFYDVRGCIDNLVNNNFHQTELEDLFYIDINFGIKDNLERPIENDLIKIGKQELNKLLNLENKNTYQKTIKK